MLASPKLNAVPIMVLLRVYNLKFFFFLFLFWFYYCSAVKMTQSWKEIYFRMSKTKTACQRSEQRKIITKMCNSVLDYYYYYDTSIFDTVQYRCFASIQLLATNWTNVDLTLSLARITKSTTTSAFLKSIGNYLCCDVLLLYV